MPFEILDTVYWATIVVFLAVATVFAIASIRRPRAAIVIVSGAFLAAALALAALPFDPLPLPVTVGVAGLSLVIAVVGGGPAATVVLEAATRGTVTQGTHGGILLARSDRRITDTPYVAPAKTEEVMRGGLVIGVLERLAIAASLMAGFPGAFAVVVAVKGVGRFTELAESESRERFIIGTLTSIIWATASAGVWLLAVA
ncbi:hypothetical protein [Paramicrobacterium chengjingii]|uniref:Uncharacterized protein n=1 Tax=Paramicrobacterium chengjingii TaxID=2769067 RepID=A0ABX6YF79_9MICO|nr:hypothetical protein [Microbacterium chengjingii]QPZ37111.1 hypothetical protein HCR76_09520 [Microbacterium chengjingii]